MACILSNDADFNHLLISLEIFSGVLERLPSALQISILLPKEYKRIKQQIPQNLFTFFSYHGL